MQKFCWMDLSGFNNNDIDYGVKRFLESFDAELEGVIILFSETSFYHDFNSENESVKLRICDCAYGGDKRYKRENFHIWTKFELKQLISELHKKDVSVYFTVFDGYSTFNKEIDDENLLQRTYDNAENYVINLLANKKDGEPYVKYLSRKLVEVIKYYNIDGIHFADGISTRRFPLQLLPCTDEDIIELKKQNSNIKQDDKINSFDKISDINSKIKKRSIYVWENYKKEGVEYCSDKWSKAFNYLSMSIKEISKDVIFNVAWLRDPFESYYRYGFDYSSIDFSNVKAIIVNDVNRKITPKSDNCGFKIFRDEYKYCENDAPATRLLTFLNSKETEQFALSPLRDINENWDVLRDAPNTVYIKAYRRNNVFFFDGSYKRINQGVVYCLSSGVDDNEWQEVKKVEKDTEFDFIKPYGFALLYEKNYYKKELTEYVRNRKPSVFYFVKELQICQMPIYTVSEIKSINKIDMPLVAVFTDYFDKQEREKLENYTLNPLVIFCEKEKMLKKEPCGVFETENGFNCYVYNIKGKFNIKVKNIINDSKIKRAREKAESIWIKKLSYSFINRVALRTICKKISKELNMLQILKNKEVMYNAVYIKDGLKVILDNPCQYSVNGKIVLNGEKKDFTILENGCNVFTMDKSI